MKRKLIVWGITLAVLAAGCGIFLLLPSGGGAVYGIKSGAVIFSESEKDITQGVVSATEYKAAENSAFELLLNSRGDIYVRHKQSGRVWSAVPQNAADAKHQSSLNIEYYDNNAPVTLYSSNSSADKKQFRVYSAENGVNIEYIFGEKQEAYIYPEQISEKRMKKLLSEMSVDDAAFIDRRYTLYSIELAEGADRDYLLNQYPRLKNENLYVLTDAANNNIKQHINSIFKSIGYTEEDKIKDSAGEGVKAENTKTFKIAVEYRLTENGFTAAVNMKNSVFYSDYPISTVDLLPNFSSFASDESGYYMFPLGGGALIDVKPGYPADGTVLSVDVYGQNTAATRKLDSGAVCTLPVFGQYKNGSAYLCVLNGGAEQARLKFASLQPYITAYPSFTIIDNGIYSMKDKADTTVFASDISGQSFSAEYILMPSAERETAYSDMAAVYRNILKKQGVLSSRAESSAPGVFAEIITAVSFDTHLAGMIPSTNETALTSFNKAGEIAEELQSGLPSCSLKLLISGWNKGGLNYQEPGTVNYSSAAGGKKDFNRLLKLLSDKNITYFVNIEMAMANKQNIPFYNSVKKSARSLNNAICVPEFLDSVSVAWKQGDVHILSPRNYEKNAHIYADKMESPDGFGLSQLGSLLTGDYANGTNLTRGESIKNITKAFEILSRKGKVSAYGGNAYTLKYLSYIDSLPSDSAGGYTVAYSIPFVQTVLHGYIPYSSGDMNDSGTDGILKLIEYGADLRYTVTANTNDKLYSSDYSGLYNTHYKYLKNKILSDGKTVFTALGGLADKEIKNHRILTDALRCVEYENGTKIYINYSDTKCDYGDVSIPAKSFLRIDL